MTINRFELTHFSYKNSSEKNKIVLLGAGGHCLDIFEALNEIGEYEISGYINNIEDPFLKEQSDLKYVGTEKDYDFRNTDGLIITFAGVGNKINSRKLAFEKYKNYSPSLIFKMHQYQNLVRFQI